jgi:DNA (cytosine-5)-methyltransferase 1
MENVRQAPIPVAPDYIVRDVLLNNRHLGEMQNRVRRFSFGTAAGTRLHPETSAFYSPDWAACVTAAHGGERRTHFNSKTGGRIQRYTVEEAIRLQGLAPDFFGPRTPFTRIAQLRMVANGVPLPMGRAIAQAVKRALLLGREVAA